MNAIFSYNTGQLERSRGATTLAGIYTRLHRRPNKIGLHVHKNVLVEVLDPNKGWSRVCVHSLVLPIPRYSALSKCMPAARKKIRGPL